MRIVKKYSNRRLYDTEESRYITLEELAHAIRDGADVFIQDAKTGGDLTQATLAQVILESRGGGRLLPVPLLVQMIRMRDEALAEFLGRYMTWAMEMYLLAKQGTSTFFPLNPLARLPFSAGNALARMLMAGLPWPSVQAPPAPASTPAPEPSPAPTPLPPAGTADDVAQLRKELDELKLALGVKPRLP